MNADDLKIIQNQLEFSGVLKWHNAGFKGKGINILDLEDEGGNHADSTFNVCSWVAPESTIFRAGMYFESDNNSVTRHEIYDNGVVTDIEEYIKTNKIKIITLSMQGATLPTQPVKDYWINLQKKYNIIMFNAAGNGGADDLVGTPFSFETSMVIGAVDLIYGTTPRKTNYSSCGKELDFVGMTMIYAGTSFACPFVASMCALIIGRYGDMSYAEIYNYLKSISLDLGDKGDDTWYGWGMPIMTDIAKKYITMTIGSNDMYVNGVKVILESPPIIDKFGKTLVPIRKPMEALGHKVSWIDSEKKVVINE